ncbi:MAG: DUF5615 family PIN-like protein, partial [Methylobacteriaceae bacterium]|nr:DUF5615 family PIN-like protein [Methylobacteriaceae bacterium]
VGLIGLADASDDAVWRRAADEGFVLVSLDADFAEMAALRGAPPKIVWLRCGNQPTRFVEQLLRHAAPALREFHDDPVAGCLELY